MSDAARKNCHSCAHLEWHDDDTDGFNGPDCGWGCAKRDPATEKLERAMLDNLARESYRNRYKRCFEPIIRLSSAASAAELEGNKK